MTRRLLLSYLSLTALVLLLLEVPLGVLYGRHERDNLTATARRDATSLAVLAGESLERPGGTELASLASSYHTRTGGEVAFYDRTGQPVVTLESHDEHGAEPDEAALISQVLQGGTPVARQRDDGGAELVTGEPVRSDTTVIGAVVVALPSARTDARVRTAWLALGLGALLLLGLAALAGFVLARSLAAPLVALQRAAQRLGRGDLDARAPPAGPAEIAALAEEFNAMADRLRQLVVAQRRFVADASHQLRTPLTALRLRLENLAATAPEDEVDDLEAAEAETQRLTRLVDGLLTLSRAENRRADRELTDLAAVADDRRAAWADLAEERGVSLAVEVAGRVESLAVPGDLEQVLDNLLSNALEVSPPGSTIRLTVRRPDHDRRVVLAVRDEGPGMTEEERGMAFERFWQGRNRSGSTGLGLAIVQQLVAANGGEVVLDAPRQGGLEVRITLPAA